ncbi:MAG TPA: glutathione S-transferase family protein [Gaiellaceae bacterium]|nr:glutathione S-transferase family protein [Gaiellaceae bacterium]
MLTLYDAARCPYCARVRIVLAEKEVSFETVEIDLESRPAWLYEKNPVGRVPVLEEDGFVLPESRVIMEYLEESYPEPPLLPPEPAERALVRLWFERFDELAQPYYRVVFDGETPEALEAELAKLDGALAASPYLVGSQFTLADVAYVPWIIRAETRAGIDLREHESLRAWLARLAQRRSVAAELEVVAATTA